MNKRLYDHIKKLLLPGLAFSMAAGFLSAVWVTAFKLAAEGVIHLSALIYGGVRSHPILIPLLVLGAAVLGYAASLILSISRSCRGGGIPTSVAAVRGMVSFKWFASIFVLPLAALLTFLCGVPLGTEGPCVQMGTAIGDGVVHALGGQKHKGWRRYIMTGGASAGFSIATSSPIAAILFSMEELHKHFSPLLLTVASVSVITAQATAQFLASLGLGTVRLFHLPEMQALAPNRLFAPLVIGLVCGGCSILFTHFYHVIDKAMRAVLHKLSTRVVFPVLFVCISLIGLILGDALGTGHSLIDTLLSARMMWLVLILVFLIRAAAMMLSNTAGVTGGVFLPTLAFGAVVGSLCAQGLIALGWIAPEHYTLMVVLGVTAFLGATSRIPITACVFAIESLGGFNNVLAIVIATTVALLVVEASGLEDFTDTVIEAKIHSLSKGKQPTVIEVPLVVGQDAFVVGKEPRDVLWPASCVVVAFERAPENRNRAGIAPTDVITVYYQTYHPAATAEEFTVLVGRQPEQVERIMNPQ